MGVALGSHRSPFSCLEQIETIAMVFGGDEVIRWRCLISLGDGDGAEAPFTHENRGAEPTR